MDYQFDLLDVIAVLSFVIGLENLEENREQSKANDVNLANDKQLQVLVKELDKRFDMVNERLSKIEERFST